MTVANFPRGRDAAEKANEEASHGSCAPTVTDRRYTRTAIHGNSATLLGTLTRLRGSSLHLPWMTNLFPRSAGELHGKTHALPWSWLSFLGSKV
jgi:hypothetical protein